MSHIGIAGPSQKRIERQLFRDSNSRNEFNKKLGAVFDTTLRFWYGVQIALLHPRLKGLFRSPKTEIIYDPNSVYPGTTKRRSTRYVRHYYIQPEDIEARLGEKTSRSISRKTPCWFVIGHYRNYKSGKRVFIPGYWKGPRREEKRNLDDGRDRLLNEPGEEAIALSK